MVIYNELEIIGSTGGTRKDLSELLGMLDKSNFRLPVYKEYSLWDIKDALYAFKDRINGRIVLVMSVYPGFSGQKFIEKSLEKVRTLRKYIDDNNYSTKIEIDGGINDETGKLAAEAGADILVSASYIFKNGIARSIKKLKSL